jgi:hypothetical protein
MSSTMTTEVFINNKKAKDEALDVTLSLRHWIHEAIAYLSKFDCYRIFEPIISWSTIILDYLKPLMHIVCSPLSLLSFIFDPFKSYLLSPNSSALATLNLGARFLLRGVVCHILKFLFQNVNHFSSINLNFQKDFIWFKLKWLYLILF